MDAGVRGSSTREESGRRLGINGGWEAASSTRCPGLPSLTIREETEEAKPLRESATLQDCRPRDRLHATYPPMATTNATTPPTIPPARTAPFGALRPDTVGMVVDMARQEVSVPLVTTNRGDAVAPILSPNATTTY